MRPGRLGRPSRLSASADLCAGASLRINQPYQSGRCLFTCYKHPLREGVGRWGVGGLDYLPRRSLPRCLLSPAAALVSGQPSAASLVSEVTNGAPAWCLRGEPCNGERDAGDAETNRLPIQSRRSDPPQSQHGCGGVTPRLSISI